MSEIIKKAASNEVVQLLYNDLRQRQENIPSAENIVMVQDQQPTVPANKVWLTETPPAGVEVPTYQEFTGVIAPDYADLDFPVSAGEHCIHNGVLYIAIQNINASEAWTAAHWEAGSVSSKLTEISTAIQGKMDEPETAGTAGQIMSLDSNLDPVWVEKNPVENISGSTQSITGVADTRYIYGEVSTLSIVAPASGCIDVIFTSGSTPTVLTVTSAKANTSIKWANGFDPSSLDANTVYELNIMDGEYGVTASWT